MSSRRRWYARIYGHSCAPSGRRVPWLRKSPPKVMSPALSSSPLRPARPLSSRSSHAMSVVTRAARRCTSRGLTLSGANQRFSATTVDRADVSESGLLRYVASSGRRRRRVRDVLKTVPPFTHRPSPARPCLCRGDLRRRICDTRRALIVRIGRLSAIAHREVPARGRARLLQGQAAHDNPLRHVGLRDWSGVLLLRLPPHRLHGRHGDVAW